MDHRDFLNELCIFCASVLLAHVMDILTCLQSLYAWLCITLMVGVDDKYVFFSEVIC